MILLNLGKKSSCKILQVLTRPLARSCLNIQLASSCKILPLAKSYQELLQDSVYGILAVESTKRHIISKKVMLFQLFKLNLVANVKLFNAVKVWIMSRQKMTKNRFKKKRRRSGHAVKSLI